MDATSIKAGPYYMIVGGETIAIDSGDMEMARKEGAGHLSRGARGFMDLSVFRAPGLTAGSLKRKVIWTHCDDIGGDAIGASAENAGSWAALP